MRDGEFDFSDPKCPARRALDLVGDKWTPRVVVTLAEGPVRYNALRRALDGVSQRMLTRSLRLLEAERLITRTVVDTIPPSVTYALTPSGQTLVDPVLAIARWGTRNLGSKESDAS